MANVKKRRRPPAFYRSLIMYAAAGERGVEATVIIDKNDVDQELARRLCAAYVSWHLGVSVATQYNKTPEDVGDVWYFLAGLANKLVQRSQNARYAEVLQLATQLIQ